MSCKNAKKGKIIVFGIAFWYPLAGVTYQFLHYLIGLRRLGYDPYYIEDSGRWVYDPRPEIDDWTPDVTGIYIESDPVASQIGVSLGNEKTIAALGAHEVHFSFGENLGAPDCGVPVERFRWLPTRQPVVLDLWENHRGGDRAAYTTIAAWRNKGKDISYRGETYYWSKDREFMKVIDLPRRCSVPFELAVGVGEEILRLLREQGWLQVNSVDLSKDINRYRTYIQNSRAEFTVAKDQNIRLRSGWFSDRSVCYLAAGRPVVTQETGFSNILPTGKGLFGFTTMEDILAAVDAIESDYEGNCRAAHEIATEYFAAEKVLGSLTERAGL